MPASERMETRASAVTAEAAPAASMATSRMLADRPGTKDWCHSSVKA